MIQGFDKKYYIGMSLLLVFFLLFIAATALNLRSGYYHSNGGTQIGEVPAEYRQMKNPYWTNLDAIVAGSRIYKDKCISCHGVEGKGDGSIGKEMKVKPFNFQDSSHMADMSDGYLYWRIMEGGYYQPYDSGMPAYKYTLTKEQIWQVLSYVHVFSHKDSLSHKAGEEVAMAAQTGHTDGHQH